MRNPRNPRNNKNNGPNAGNSRRLYVTNIHKDIINSELKVKLKN